MDASIQVAELKAGRGGAWLVEAFHIFRRKPLAWVGLCAGWLVITFGLLLLPIIGGVIASFLQPVFFASFAIIAVRQLHGEKVLMGDLFLGFRRNLKPLINLGAILLMTEIAVFAIMALLGLPMATAGDKPFTVNEYVEALGGKEWILMLGFFLTVTIKGAFWFAPPLIALHDMSTTHAMRWSVYAFLANFGAMMLYGITLFMFFFAALIPWALGLILVIPLMAISTYVGYREVFEAREGYEVAPP
jgi:hypothetical protein